MQKQLTRNQLYTVSMHGKRSQKSIQTHWLYTIAHWSGPPRTYVDFSLDQQGRLVYVRKAVAATCIKILSRVTQCNEDLIACSVLLSVISFGIIFTIQPCLQ